MNFYIKARKKRTIKKVKDLRPGVKVLFVKQENRELCIGKLKIGLLKDGNLFETIENETSARVEIVSELFEDILILYSDLSQCRIKIVGVDVNFTLALLSFRSFAFEFIQENEEVSIKVFSTKLPIISKGTSSVIKYLFKLLFNLGANLDHYGLRKEVTNIEQNIDSVGNMNDIFTLVREKQLKKYTGLEVFQPCIYLKPQLRPYQKQAVNWMLKREMEASSKEILHPFYHEITLQSGVPIFYNEHSGHVVLEKPLVQYVLSGGILADEMGLGKTIEVLACILHGIPEDSKKAGKVNFIRQRKRQSFGTSDKQQVSSECSSAKKLILLNGLTVSKPEKSELRHVLNEYYNSTLVSINDKPKPKIVSDVCCVCGYLSRKGLVQCTDCQIRQHSKCVGYEKLFGPFLCTQCRESKPLLKTNATLIVCPRSLCKQWMQEIERHVGCNIKVFNYTGCNSLSPTYPVQLQMCDIVITAYNVLQTEFKFVDQCRAKSLRNQQRYASPGSPIMAIHWKRLCLDEAQVVQNAATIVAEMSARLTADHRWAVTGTPVSVSLSDICGLVNYLQIEPYNDKNVFHQVLYKPFVEDGNKEGMLNFLSEILWRTQKKDVVDQISIPVPGNVTISVEFNQIKRYFYDKARELSKTLLAEKISIPAPRNVTINVEFNQIERYFYDKERELSKTLFAQKVQQFKESTPLATLGKQELLNLLKPIISLRKACVHHKTVNGRYLLSRKPVNSVQDLLNALILKSKNECEDHMQVIITDLNGLAGIYLLLQNPITAIEQYKKIEQLEETFTKDDAKIKVGIDTLPLIHMYHNYSEVLRMHKNLQVGTVLDDIKRKREQLETKFLDKREACTKQSILALCEHNNDVVSLERKIQGRECWYSHLISEVFASDLINNLDTALKNAFDKDSVDSTVFVREETGLIFRLQTWENTIESFRDESLSEVNNLYNIDGDERISFDPVVVQQAVNCHLRPDQSSDKKKKKTTSKKCTMCQVYELLEQYAAKLFSEVKSQNKKQFAWKLSQEETIMLAVLRLMKSKRNVDKDLLMDAKVSLERLECLKKELKSLRKVWTDLDAQMRAVDEIAICKQRFKFKDDDEEDEDEALNRAPKYALNQLSYEIENRLENINQISQHELDLHRVNLESDLITTKRLLEKSLGTHNYLKSLHDRENASRPRDPCPICHTELTDTWNVLRCGHSYCFNCIQIMLNEQKNSAFVICAVCREKIHKNDISCIETKAKEQKADSLVGSCSSKVEKIVQLVRKLVADEENVKILVFSTWNDVLQVIHDVFSKNSIRSEVILLANEADKKLGKFKSDEGGVSVLLLPITLGGKGLNLIEASHVIFVEPLLDPSEESQAVGRVHRFGQKREVLVYKFVLSDSIEEKINQAVTSEDSAKWHKTEVTVKQIKDLICST